MTGKPRRPPVSLGTDDAAEVDAPFMHSQGHDDGWTDAEAGRAERGITINYTDARRDDEERSYDIRSIHSCFGESVIVSMLSCCCCSLPIGLTSVYYASKVDGLILRGKPQQAARYARTARILVAVTAVVTAILYAVVVFLLSQLLVPL
ncbi:hypothetical protein BC831DRAFT_516509 [Entophlyctis helioformis]|nr:hypothetical protein BC831DRAFT_516509 [Entophlyctis helioformis]